MARITVEIPDLLHEWLLTDAERQRASLDDTVASCIRARRANFMPTAEEIYLLGIFQNISLKPGWLVTSKSLWNIWGLRGSPAELESALTGLITKNFIDVQGDGGGYALTRAGFQFRPASA